MVAGGVINLTQHLATADQAAAGVVDLSPEERAHLSSLLTFEEVPTAEEISDRADALSFWVMLTLRHNPRFAGVHAAMIGGAPWFMGPLADGVQSAGFTPVFAFSRRESVDAPQPDGTVRKTAVFRHSGWVPWVR